MSKLSAVSSVNVIDSIKLTEEKNTDNVLAEWSVFEPGIIVYERFKSAQAVKLFINWSDKNGMIDLQTGDYFTFIIPDVFNHNLVNYITDAPITNDEGEIVATYSIRDYDDVYKKKELIFTFTDYVETHTQISGFLWLLLFVGEVDSTSHKNLEFVINGNLEAEAVITIDPHKRFIPKNEKNGYSNPPRNVNGYYIFEWIVFINMLENKENGFNTYHDFSFEDIIPLDSPHVFISSEIRQRYGLPFDVFVSQIGEYTGSDAYPPLNRYPVFENDYNSTGPNIWYNSINWKDMVNGHTTVGIDGNGGLHLSDIEITDKLYSAKLGTLTRPTAIRFFTISTIKIDKNALGDSEVVKLYKNTFKGNSLEELPSTLQVYRFESGGGSQGITGDYGFSFTKVDEKGAGIPGAMFALYISDDFSIGANRIVYSDSNGVVSFIKLPAQTYYMQETVRPTGYILDSTIYKVELSTIGFEIYYGDQYANKLSDRENKVVNKLEYDIQPVSVTLTGTKILTGLTLSSGMFHFVVKDKDGAATATGTNDADGVINCSEIEFDKPGVYTFTVEEVRGGYSGITYDVSLFAVTVTVTEDENRKLTAEVSYPAGGVVFNNIYSQTPVKPCPCYARKTKCRMSIKGRKIWIDDNNAGVTRPVYIEIILFRDDKVYKRIEVDSTGDGVFIFCCLPIGKRPGHKYNYRIDEAVVPDGYTKTIDGYDVINTLTP